MTPSQEHKFAEALLAAAETVVSAVAATKGTPLQWLLQRTQRDAAQSLVALIDVDPEDAKQVRGLQNEVKRFRDIVSYLREAIAAGDEAEFRLAQEARNEFLGLIQSEGAEAL